MLKRCFILISSLLGMSLIGCGQNQFHFEPASNQNVSKTELPGESHTGETTEAGCLGLALEVCVTICHIPEGNAEARQTIWVGRSALEAHINQHEDFVGTCEGGPSDAPSGDLESEVPTQGSPAGAMFFTTPIIEDPPSAN